MLKNWYRLFHQDINNLMAHHSIFILEPLSLLNKTKLGTALQIPIIATNFRFQLAINRLAKFYKKNLRRWR